MERWRSITIQNKDLKNFKAQNYILRNCILSENYMDNQDSEIAEAEMSQLATGFEGRVEVIIVTIL